MFNIKKISCVDNFKRADVSKYTPSKKDQEVALFSATKATKKRKRFVLENLHSDTKADRKHSRSAIKRLSSLETHKTKIRKTKSIAKQDSDKKITIKLKRKDSKKREVTRSLSFDTNPKATKRSRPKAQKKAKAKTPTVSKILFRSGSLHRRIIKTRNPDLEGTLDELKVRNMPESEDEASEKSYYSERRRVPSPGDLDIDGILEQREKAQESSRIREMILRYASIEYPIAVETYNMVSDQDTNIEDGDLDFSVKSPVVRPFEHSGNYEPMSILENSQIELDFAHLQPTCCTGGDMLEEKDDEEEENGIEIEDEVVGEVPPNKVVCESPPMDTLKPEGSNTFETPVTKAGTSVNKDSIEKGFSTPAKKSSDMKKLIDNIYSDFKGIEEVKEEITDSSMLVVRGRRPAREKASAERTFNYFLRSNSKEKLSVSSKNDDVPVAPVISLATTRQPRQKKSSIVAKGLNDSGLGKMKGKKTL